MNPVALEPIGATDESAIGPPGGNTEAGISDAPRKPIKTYCIDVYEDETYGLRVESPGDAMPAEGEDASLTPAPVEGDGGMEGGASLGDNLTAVAVCQAFVAAEKARLSGGDSQEQDGMDQGFAGQGGGAIHG